MVDVRPDDRVPPKDAGVFRVTAAACGQAGWKFRRAGAIDPVVRANIRWLSRYRHQRCRIEPAAAELLEAFTPDMPLLAGASRVGDRSRSCRRRITCSGGASWHATCPPCAIRKVEGLGWLIVINLIPTGIGWLAAMVMAFALPRRERAVAYQSAYYYSQAPGQHW